MNESHLKIGTNQISSRERAQTQLDQCSRTHTGAEIKTKGVAKTEKRGLEIAFTIVGEGLKAFIASPLH